MELGWFFVQLLLLPISLALGYVGGRAHVLALLRELQGLSLRLGDVEARLVRESKRYAGNLSAKSRSVDDELLDMARKTVEAGKTASGRNQDPFYFPEG